MERPDPVSVSALQVLAVQQILDVVYSFLALWFLQPFDWAREVGLRGNCRTIWMSHPCCGFYGNPLPVRAKWDDIYGGMDCIGRILGVWDAAYQPPRRILGDFGYAHPPASGRAWMSIGPYGRTEATRFKSYPARWLALTACEDNMWRAEWLLANPKGKGKGKGDDPSSSCGKGKGDNPSSTGKASSSKGEKGQGTSSGQGERDS